MTTSTTRARHDVWQERVDSGDWEAIAAELDEYGGALLPRLLSDSETAQIRDLYGDDSGVWHTLALVFHDAA